MSTVLKNVRNDLKEYFLFFLCAFVLILLTHLTIDRLDTLISLGMPNIEDVLNRKTLIYRVYPNLRGMFYLYSVAILALPVIRDVFKFSSTPSKAYNQIRSIGLAIIVFSILFVLHPQFGPRSMGIEYGEIAANPFRQLSDLFSRRLLMPAVAHIFFFRGYWLYYIFCVILTIYFVAALHSWLTRSVPLSAWEYLSICTSSFVFYQFQFPGYPDILVYIFFLFVMQDEISLNSKLTLLVLSLFVHESSLFVGLILAWRFLDRKRCLWYVLVLVLYFLIWMAVSQSGPQTIFASNNIEDLSGIDWVIKNPGFEILGIFFSYKILWVVVFWAMIQSYRSEMYRDIVYIGGLLGAGLLMTLLAVDTSRLLGFTFPMLLFSLNILANKPLTQLERKILSIVFLFNLFIPSVYVGLNMGPVVDSGLYAWLYNGILGLITGVNPSS